MTQYEFTSENEGIRRKVYKCTAGKNTIGIGHNIDAKGLPDDIEDFLDKNGYITDLMIRRLFDMDVEDAEDDARRLYPDFDSFSDARRIALVDFLFNVGYSVARTFQKTNRAINAGKWEAAANMLLASKYARQVGKRARKVAELLREG